MIEVSWNTFWHRESSGINLAICRIVVIGSCLLFFFPPLQTHIELLRYNTSFTTPQHVQQLAAAVIGEEHLRSVATYTAIHWFTVTAGILAVVGLFTRVSSGVFAIGYLLLVTHRWSYGGAMQIGPVKPVDTLNAIFFLILPFSACGFRLSLDAWIANCLCKAAGKRRATRTLNADWALKLTGIVIAMVYANTAWCKFVNGGLMWFNGYAVRDMNFVRGVTLDLPGALWISQHLTLCQMISVLVVGFELLFVTGLIWRRLLPFWLICAGLFHLCTYFFYRTHFHFLSWIILYVVYVDFEVLMKTVARRLGTLRWARNGILPAEVTREPVA